MNDPKPPDERNQAEPPVSGKARVHSAAGDSTEFVGPDAREDDDELRELDELGVDGVVAQRTSGAERWESRRRRPPWVSVLVVLACLYPLYAMWGDLRFWLRSSEPEQLGDAAVLFADGQLPTGLDNRYVALDGTPDVQWATVLTKRSGAKVSYLRVLEGEGRLFAAVPRPEADDGRTPRYPSRFTGRVSRFGDSGAFAWIAQLFAQEGVTQVRDVTPEVFLDALARRQGGTLRMVSAGRVVNAAPSDAVRLVVRPLDARVLLGVESFPDAAAADAAVASLGYPYLALGRGRSGVWRYVVRAPEPEWEQVRLALRAKVSKDVDPADPKEGVSVFRLSSTYTARASDLALDEGSVVFAYGANTAAPGYKVQDGRLVAQDLAGGTLRIRGGELAAVRVETPVEVDPSGYLIEAGVTPASQLKWAMLWFAVLFVALINAGLAVKSLRRGLS